MVNKRYQLVEVPILATIVGTLQQIYFQQQPQLQTVTGDKIVYVDAIETFTADSLALSPFTGAVVAGAAALANATLSLSIAGDYGFLNVPLVCLAKTLAPGSFAQFQVQPFEFRNISKVDWTKSYISLAAAPVAPPFSYMFGVSYHFSDDI